MSDVRRSAVLAGTMFIAATAAGVASVVVFGSLLDGSDYLSKMAGEPDRAATAAALEALMGLACAGIAFALYPVLRRTHPTAAIASAGLRVVEGTLFLIAAAVTLALVALSQDGLAAGTLGDASTRSSAEILRSLADQCAVLAALPFAAAAFLYYWVFWRTGLVPAWLSLWGLAAISVYAGVGLLAIVSRTDFDSYSALLMPLALQEMVLAVWLLVKGFSAVTVAVATASMEDAR
jgi:hypothetical protein